MTSLTSKLNSVTRKAVSLLLAGVMCLSLLPVAVYAANDEGTTKDVYKWDRVYSQKDLPIDKEQHPVLICWKSNEKNYYLTGSGKNGDSVWNDRSRSDWDCIAGTAFPDSCEYPAPCEDDCAFFYTDSPMTDWTIQYVRDDEDNENAHQYFVRFGENQKYHLDGYDDWDWLTGEPKDTRDERWSFYTKELGGDYADGIDNGKRVAIFANVSGRDTDFAYIGNKAYGWCNGWYDECGEFAVYVGHKETFNVIGGQVIGEDQTLQTTGNCYIRKGQTLSISPGGTLVVDGYLFNSGTIENRGTIIMKEGACMTKGFESDGYLNCSGADYDLKAYYEQQADNCENNLTELETELKTAEEEANEAEGWAEHREQSAAAYEEYAEGLMGILQTLEDEIARLSALVEEETEDLAYYEKSGQKEYAAEVKAKLDPHEAELIKDSDIRNIIVDGEDKFTLSPGEFAQEWEKKVNEDVKNGEIELSPETVKAFISLGVKVGQEGTTKESILNDEELLEGLPSMERLAFRILLSKFVDETLKEKETLRAKRIQEAKDYIKANGSDYDTLRDEYKELQDIWLAIDEAQAAYNAKQLQVEELKTRQSELKKNESTYRKAARSAPAAVQGEGNLVIQPDARLVLSNTANNLQISDGACVECGGYLISPQSIRLSNAEIHVRNSGVLLTGMEMKFNLFALQSLPERTVSDRLDRGDFHTWNSHFKGLNPNDISVITGTSMVADGDWHVIVDGAYAAVYGNGAAPVIVNYDTGRTHQIEGTGAFPKVNISDKVNAVNEPNVFSQIFELPDGTLLTKRDDGTSSEVMMNGDEVIKQVDYDVDGNIIRSIVTNEDGTQTVYSVAKHGYYTDYWTVDGETYDQPVNGGSPKTEWKYDDGSREIVDRVHLIGEIFNADGTKRCTYTMEMADAEDGSKTVTGYTYIYSDHTEKQDARGNILSATYTSGAYKGASYKCEPAYYQSISTWESGTLLWTVTSTSGAIFTCKADDNSGDMTVYCDDYEWNYRHGRPGLPYPGRYLGSEGM